ncbi:orotidine-5'-phosphate decarboxylase [soil metagenome]
MNKEKIIVALDVETAGIARQIITELRGEVGAFKIGLQLFSSAGSSFVRELVADGIKIFLDVKFHDIPNTVAKAAVEVARMGVWMFNIHTIGGSEMMRKTVECVGEVCARENLRKPTLIGVTVLTSSDSETLHEIGIEREVTAQVLSLAGLAVKNGLDGVVASPLETKIIREQFKKEDFLIVTPGIRNKVSEKSIGIETYEDQKRVMTAKEAVFNGSDFLVIGRPILHSENRLATVKNILEEMQTAINN